MNLIGTNIFALIIVLGVLIFVHEAGHFLVAKLFKVRVLVFSLGFGKRLFGFRRGDTDYRISLIPLGGYVRMAGDIPEENTPSDPTEFLSKPKWQRFLILIAGPAMNILLAIAFMTGIEMHGTQRLISRPIIAEVQKGGAGERAGLQAGDRIVAVNGEPIQNFEDFRLAITLNAKSKLRVEYLRNGARGETILIPIREESDYGPIGRAGLVPFIDPIVGPLRPDSPAQKAGVRTGDRIATVAGKPVTHIAEFEEAMIAAKGAAIPLTLVRNGQPVNVTLPKVQYSLQDLYRGFFLPTTVRQLPFGAAVQESVRENWRMLRYAVNAIKRLFRPEGSIKELSGLVTIARISGDMLRAGLKPLIGLMAMISLQLGVMNLLPIPVLDGGHIMILLIEGIARRDLSLRVKERIQQLGFAVLAALMIVVLYNDVLANVMRMNKSGG